MLPVVNRLRRSQEFSAVVRGGRRSGRPRVVVHLEQANGSDAVRVGLVVSRQVGGSVVRTLVKRRLRHLMRDRLAQLPPGCSVVVRANAAAAESSYQDLGRDLDKALGKLLPGAVS